MRFKRLEELELEAKRKGNPQVLHLIQSLVDDVKTHQPSNQDDILDELIEFAEFQLSDEHTELEKMKFLIDMKIKQLRKLNNHIGAEIDEIIDDIEMVIDMAEHLPEHEKMEGLEAISLTISAAVEAII